MPVPNLDKLERMVQQRGQPFRVLIVDDEKWIREVFQDFCRLTNAFDVELAASGSEAIEKVKTCQYDLVTMDLIMPEVSGLEALGAIKEISPRLPVVVITGYATDRLINRAGLEGAARVLYKPVRLEDFVEELTCALAR
jgi:two-component system chemotaxis response regulator CheY